MRKPEYPKELKGFILIYTDGGSPSIRVFETKAAMNSWVGEWYLQLGKSDSHWVDGYVEGKFTLIDESIHVTDEEPKDESPRPEEVS